MNETISVRIQGESDWLNSVFNIQELNNLKDSTLNLPLISAKIGRLLDIGSATLSIENRKEVERLLSQYVANLNIYQKMLEQEMSSLFITSYRAKGPFSGYMTRVAGATKDHIANSIIVLLDNPDTPTPEDTGYTILLKLIFTNTNYKKDKYHSKSFFHDTYRLAQQCGEKTEIRRVDSPQSN